MHIEAELDPIHAERLTQLQARLQKSLPEVLADAIDAALAQIQTPGARPYRILEEERLIGYIEGDDRLSEKDKKHLWGSEP